MGLIIAFWTAAALVGYAYVGYPLLVWLASRRAARARPLPRRRPAAPRVSVIVAAYNEAGCIAQKIDSALRQDYPPERLQVVVVSDGSTDGTDAIVERHADPRVRLIRQEPRAGKSAALNRGVAAATGDVLVFTDANALFAPGSIARLAAPFAERRVGLVSGQGLYAESHAADARVVANGYVRYEALLRAAEGRLGFLAGADGAIYALRRGLYRDLAPAEVNDLLHPIQAALAGYVCRFEPTAFTVEPPSGGAGQEFRRHVRIIAQGIALTRRWFPPLVAGRRWRAVWLLLSHRVLRWGAAPVLLVALGANLALLERGPLYAVTLATQLAFYAVAAAGAVADRLGVRLGTLAIPHYFCVVTAAGVAGFARALGGGAEAVWTPAGGATGERAARRAGAGAA
jgi:cellulose synthase/poly-beta-1,6-N-acetylglucosamine synthase-like glycosyltransferase